MHGRRRLIACTAVAFLAAAVTTPAAWSAEPGTAEGARVVKTGWWWRANDAPDDEAPVGGAEPAAQPVPPGSLPVAATGGEAEKVAAIEFSVDGPAGSSVDSFVLTLRESAEPGANVNVDSAAVLACPVTDTYWEAGEGAQWSTRPGYDCGSGAVAGERGADGVWTFDLTSLAQDWTDPYPMSAPAVVLVEDVGAPESFQVVFDGVQADGVGLDVQTTPPPDRQDRGAAGRASDAAGTGTSGAAAPNPIAAAPPGGGSSAGTSTGTLGGLGSTSTSSTGTAAVPEVGTASAPVPSAATGGVPRVATRAVAAQPVSTVAPPWYAGIPWAGYLLLPLALGVAYLAMLALGPDAQPAAAGTGHGVSRALERLQRVGQRVTSRRADQ